MSTNKLIIQGNAILHELSDPTITNETFKIKEKNLLDLITISNLTEFDETELIILSLYRTACVSKLDFLIIVRIQGKVNRRVSNELKKLGADVSELDSYLEKDVKPYFPS